MISSLSLPPTPTPDSTLALLREGYPFIATRCDRLRSPAFRTRLMLTPVVCMRGAEAARVFYAPGRFTRVGAMPKGVLRLLQDEGSVVTLDGAMHRGRKRLFLDIVAPARIEALVGTFARCLRAAFAEWARRDSVELHRAFGDVVGEAVIAWAGMALPTDERRKRARELASMVDHAGSWGPVNWWARARRRRTERWARDAVLAVRRGDADAPPDSALARIAAHLDADGQPLWPEHAAVELLNVLRPTVAVAHFMLFAALALSEHPPWRERFAAGDEADLLPFVQEIRRLYPFFPMVGGRAKEVFDAFGHRFAPGDWVLLDLHGTNHDPALWPDPHAFRPERFRAWQPDPFTLIPQGGGDVATGHRCPGEALAIALTMEAVRLLAREVRYTVPVQDLSIGLRRMPALPASGLVIREVAPA